MSVWKKVGVIGVDAGICWVGDPCYILHKKDEERPKAIGKNWGEFCDILDSLHESQNDGALQLNYDMGHPGLGVVVSTGYGDGEYPVYARLKRGRVAEIRVVFVDDDISTDNEGEDNED